MAIRDDDPVGATVDERPADRRDDVSPGRSAGGDIGAFADITCFVLLMT